MLGTLYNPRMALDYDVKHEILDHILSTGGLERIDLISFLSRVWPLSQMPSTDSRFKDAAGDIWQHMVNNNDWTMDDLLIRRLGLLGADDSTFVKFLEAYVHPRVRSGEAEQGAAVVGINRLLGPRGFQLVTEDQVEPKRYRVEAASGSVAPAFEVVLSFAGEQRAYVEEVARTLVSAGVRIFYDNYEVASIWGKNLVEHLAEVYGGTARYCVMFVSADYVAKIWPSHERRSAFDAAIARRTEYILPVRFDATPVPGLLNSIHYVEARNYTSYQLAHLILQKLGRV
jgi:AbiJ N-terminal domain 3/TIR domain